MKLILYNMTRLRIGCSGFSYKDWKGTFYPGDLPGKRWLAYYSEIFPTVELNVTFYRLPGAEIFTKWYGETPADFSFALKGSRLITHLKRLRDVEGLVDEFFARALSLKEKLSVVLWQFPSSFTFEKDRFKKFLAILDKYPAWNAFEFRSDTWVNEDVTQMCRNHGAALCMADWPQYIAILPITAGFVYIRRHGEQGSYTSSYSRESLERDAGRIRTYLDEGLDVFVYFNNDACGYAPNDARELMELVDRGI
ncbi:MAG: DUF72 domain-containing protein [Syntrophorhabdaceae bacterium]|nr:DUF72 domain-containing protein [Syntrophorhabdaceae bacterium]MDD4196695.1 DUF72 domain-containing protein [Syntrophorhabdaceae bacterium]HOC45582.1 DUF72 domain-containing protein [Syntrophorhabdaceae bacterium]